MRVCPLQHSPSNHCETKVRYTKCGRKNAVVGEVSEEERKEILCPECETGKKKLWWNWEVAACPEKENTQQERDVRRTREQLQEVWLKIGLEKVDTHKGLSVKALLGGAMSYDLYEMHLENK